MARKSTRRQGRPINADDPLVQQRVVMASYAFGWIAAETSVLGWRLTFGFAGLVRNKTTWQRWPGNGDLNGHINEIIVRYEKEYGISRK